jgi:hypothetical protein
MTVLLSRFPATKRLRGKFGVLVRSLASQLVRDLQVSWQKTAILCALFLVGLYFWIPPLLRAIGGPSTPFTVHSEAAPALPVQPPAAAARPETQTRTLSTWQQGDQLQSTDPLVRSAELAAIRSDPFRVDEKQFPPPVLFEEEPEEPRTEKISIAAEPAPADSVVLRSTIVGVSRRAAFINQKLYFEGSEVRVKGEPWLLSEIHPRKVVLRKGEATMELTIAGQSPATSEE